MIFRQPYKDPKISQEFGLDFIWHNPKTEKDEWFYKETYAPLQGHPGIDFACKIGTPIGALHDGICLYVGYDDDNGNLVQIWNETEGYKTLYGHNSEFRVKQGDYVKAGQIIALSGKSGAGTGPHSHIGGKMTKEGGNTKYPNNGFNGAFDILPFIKLDYLGNKLKDKNMVLKKAKNDPNIYLVNEEFGTKMMVSCMEAYTALKDKYEEVDSLDAYIPNGTFVWTPYIIN